MACEFADMDDDDAPSQKIPNLTNLSAKSVVEQYATQFPDDVASMPSVRDACYSAVCRQLQMMQFVRFCNDEQHVDVLVSDLPSVPFGNLWKLLSEVPNLHFLDVTDIHARCRGLRTRLGHQSEAFCECFPKIGQHVTDSTSKIQAVEICIELETDESITWSVSEDQQMNNDSIQDGLLNLMYYFEILQHPDYGCWDSFAKELKGKAYTPCHPFSEHANPKLVIYIDDESSKSCSIMLTHAGNLH
jgi:hypothetical protein